MPFSAPKAFDREQNLSLLKCLRRKRFTLWSESKKKKAFKKVQLLILKEPDGLGVFWE